MNHGIGSTRKRVVSLAAVLIAGVSLSAFSLAEAKGVGGGGFGGRHVGGKGGRRAGAQAQTLIDNAVRNDNLRRARRAIG